MKVTKITHSCLLLEKNGKRLLIDPGKFSMLDSTISTSNIGSVDAIIITHQHWDHYDAETIKQFLKMKTADIYAVPEICELLKKEGVQSNPTKSEDEIVVAGFAVKVIGVPHGPLLVPLPEHAAYLIDGKLLHTGDSLELHHIKGCEVLALPIAGPWMTLIQAFELAKALRPKVVIPIHDGILKEFMSERVGSMLKGKLTELGIECLPIKSGTIEI